MRPLAFSSNAFKQNTLAEAIDALADIGYAGVELMADLHHAWPLTFDTDRRAATKRQLKSRGLVVSNVNCFTCFVHGDTYHPTFITDDPAKLKIRVDHTKATLEVAAEFESRTISIQPGGPMIGTGLTYEAAAERFAEAIHDCLPTAQKRA
ncbi:MAG: TIM barrel protein [Tepidisphaeraceae bacterium]